MGNRVAVVMEKTETRPFYLIVQDWLAENIARDTLPAGARLTVAGPLSARTALLPKLSGIPCVAPGCWPACRSKTAPPTYRTTTWRASNAALQQRGSLQVWFDPRMVRLAKPGGKRGGSATFTDAAIQACRRLKALFGRPLRQTTGLVASLLGRAGLDWPVPDFSTLSRRQNGLTLAIPYRSNPGALQRLIDIEPESATGSREPARGIRSEGDGEWIAKKHRPSRSWQWHKVRVRIDADKLEI